jgi:hypothetical protein
MIVIVAMFGLACVSPPALVFRSTRLAEVKVRLAVTVQSKGTGNIAPCGSGFVVLLLIVM